MPDEIVRRSIKRKPQPAQPTPYTPPVPGQVDPRILQMDPGALADARWLVSQKQAQNVKVVVPPGVRGPAQQSRVEFEGNVRRHEKYEKRRQRGIDCRKSTPGGGETSRRVPE